MLSLTLISFFLFPIGSLFLSFVGISCSKNKFSRLVYCIIISIVLSLIAYFYEPSPAYDLYRIFERTEWMKETSLSNIIEIFGSNLELGFNISIYFIANIFGKHAIPAIFTFLGNFLAFYVISDYTMKKQISKTHTFLVVIIFFLSFQHMYLISGIRNFVSFVFLFSLLYIEKINKKESLITHLLYIVPVLFHSSMIVFIFLRILLEFKNKIIEKVVYIMSILAFIAPPILLYVLSFFKSNFLILTIYNKLNSYFSYDTSRFYTFMILLAMFIQLFIYCYMYIKVKKNSSKHLDTNNQFYVYMKWILLLGIGVMRYAVLLDRILVLLSCLSIILMTDYFKFLNGYRKENKFMCSCIVLAMAVLLFRNQLHNYYSEIESSINTVSKINILNFNEMGGRYD